LVVNLLYPRLGKENSPRLRLEWLPRGIISNQSLDLSSLHLYLRSFIAPHILPLFFELGHFGLSHTSLRVLMLSCISRMALSLLSSWAYSREIPLGTLTCYWGKDEVFSHSVMVFGWENQNAMAIWGACFFVAGIVFGLTGFFLCLNSQWIKLVEKSARITEATHQDHVGLWYQLMYTELLARLKHN